MILTDFEITDIGRYVGLWCISHPFYVDVQGEVDPVVIKDALERQTYWVIYHIEDVEGEYLLIRSNKGIEKIKPAGVVLIESPSYKAGEKILIQRTSGAIHEAIIDYVVWHSKRATHYYAVTVAGKRISRWVFEDDVLKKL